MWFFSQLSGTFLRPFAYQSLSRTLLRAVWFVRNLE
jgi:hypothetical protein